jgi:hypothetical protein
MAVRFLPHTVVAEEIEELTDRYADALAVVANALDLNAETFTHHHGPLDRSATTRRIAPADTWCGTEVRRP